MPSDLSRLPGDLLAHAEFMRAVARVALRGDPECEDLEQDAWVAALEGAPKEPARQRPWLASVVRNRAVDFLRRRSRRHARERAASRPETLPSASDLAERAETGRRLVTAVLALEEPYRSVILLRFQEGLPPREIARRLGVPVETARTRVRRALARLRALLDEGDEGRRRAWALELAALADAGAAPSLKVIGTSKLALVAVGLLLLGAATWWTVGALGRGDPSSHASVETANAARRENERATPTLAAAKEGDAARVPQADPVGAQRTQGAVPARAGAGTARPLVVRVTADDTPRPGVLVRLRRRDGLGLPAVAATDAKGLVSFDDADRVSCDVEAFADGFVPERIPIPLLAADADGVVTFSLQRGVPFFGRVVDAPTGEGIVGASVAIGTDAENAVEFEPSGAEGRFHAPGATDRYAMTLVARAPGHVPLILEITVSEGKVQPAEPVLALERGGALTGLVVSADGTPVAGASVRAAPGVTEAAMVVADSDRPSPDDPKTSDGMPYDRSIDFFENDTAAATDRYRMNDVLHSTTAADGSFRLEGLKFDQEYGVSAVARGQAGSTVTGPLVVTAVAPERRVTIALRKPALVLLAVHVPAKSSLPDDARVRLFPGRDMRTPDGREADGRFRFTDVVPGPASAFVHAEGFRPAATNFTVPEGRTVEVSLDLDVGVVVEGVVVGADGKPVAEAVVAVAPSSQNEEAGYDRTLNGDRHAISDSEGRFSVTGVVPGDVVLVATGPSESSLATRERIRLSAPARAVRVVVVLLGSLRVRLLAPDGHPFVGPIDFEAHGPHFGIGSSDYIADGVVERDGLDDGPYTLILVPKDYAWVRRTVTIRNGARADLGQVTLDPGVDATGRVVDADGSPIAQVRVTCDALRLGARVAFTDAQGRFVLAHAAREQDRLRFAKEGLADASATFDPNQERPIEVRMSPPVAVRAVIRRPAGSMPTDGRLELRPPGAKAMRATVVTFGTTKEITYYEGAVEFLPFDASGRFAATVAAGRWLVIWRDADGKEHQVGDWTVVGGETREFEATLPGR